jgi:endonuclease/exonuclease/phosphatase family metal-dependent hydrolase
MKRKFLSVIMIALCLMTQAQTMRVASYNIRFDNPDDSLDRWNNRYPYIADLVRLYDFDIFGTQEGLFHQLEDLKNNLKSYDYIGVGRDDGARKGEYTAIYYKAGKYELLDKGNFWLSAITDKPNKGWDAALPRICTWGKFKEKASGRIFYLFNTHFDHKGEIARKESVLLILEKIRAIAGKNTAILTGDFNFDETNPNYTVLKNSGLLHDSFDLAGMHYAPGGTFTAFDITSQPKGRIDHIFITEDVQVTRYGILTNTYNGRYPSDHFPVFAELVFIAPAIYKKNTH